jgi:hypothetical protein
MKKKSEKSTQMDYIDSVVHLYFLGYSVEEAIKEVKPCNKDEVIECLKSVITI